MTDPVILDLDLFGDAVQRGEKGRGRPEHVWTLKNSNKVLLMFARRSTKKEAAVAIGVSVPTLQKHYFFELAKREASVLMMEATQLERLNEQAMAGNVAAEKELMKALAKGRIEAMSVSVAQRGRTNPKVPALGKKDSAKAAAKELKGRFATREAPLALLN